MILTMSTDVSYVAFVLGFTFLDDVFRNSMMHCDEAYDYCIKLAEEFLLSEHNNAYEPVIECIENFVNDKMQNIEEYIRDFNVSLGV